MDTASLWRWCPATGRPFILKICGGWIQMHTNVGTKKEVPLPARAVQAFPPMTPQERTTVLLLTPLYHNRYRKSIQSMPLVAKMIHSIPARTVLWAPLQPVLQGHTGSYKGRPPSSTHKGKTPGRTAWWMSQPKILMGATFQRVRLPYWRQRGCRRPTI